MAETRAGQTSTPGPWTVRGDEVWGPAEPKGHDGRLGRIRGFTDEDARLIAAAPELLEALRFTWGALVRLNDARAVVDLNPEMLTEELTDIERNVGAVIAKATGCTCPPAEACPLHGIAASNARQNDYWRRVRGHD